jgi:hypothetical protein
MNEHAGPACALSVLIVGFFAVLLHDRGQSTPTANPIAQNRSASVPDRVVSPAKDGSPRPIREPQLASPTPTASASAKMVEAPSPSTSIEFAPISPSKPPSPSTAAPKPLMSGGEVARTPRALPVRTPFTVVLSGETLADVATRVYGSSDSTRDLWKANRDQVARIDSVLARGMLLRTP